jgi:hypothetical protein
LLSKDIVIFVVPQFQKIHDYKRGYKDYWRFTPFSVDKLFNRNGLSVLYRKTTYGFSESMYLFYIASKKPDKWKKHFPELLEVEDYLNSKNDGTSLTIFSHIVIKLDTLIRKIANFVKNK